MTEPHIRNLLGGYSLGILDADEQRSVDGHLAGCAECRVELAEVIEATEMLALLPADEARGLFADEPGPVAVGRSRTICCSAAPCVRSGPSRPATALAGCRWWPPGWRS